MYACQSLFTCGVLFYAGHVAILQWMLHHSLVTGVEADDFGATPVHDAAEQGQLESLKVFYEHAVNLDSQDCDGLTPRYVLFLKLYSLYIHPLLQKQFSLLLCTVLTTLGNEIAIKQPHGCFCGSKGIPGSKPPIINTILSVLS